MLYNLRSKTIVQEHRISSFIQPVTYELMKVSVNQTVQFLRVKLIHIISVHVFNISFYY
jgi:hypothetical protein